MGGPNLTPEDGWLSACVAASPGQPTHVLEYANAADRGRVLDFYRNTVVKLSDERLPLATTSQAPWSIAHWLTQAVTAEP